MNSNNISSQQGYRGDSYWYISKPNKKGYEFVYTRCPVTKRMNYDHVIRAEKVLDRRLKRGEVVHHINGNKLDNRNENLLICGTGYHTDLHWRMGTFDGTPIGKKRVAKESHREIALNESGRD